jgi:predicted RNA binding protein YcfA (HicA-like mRNA interferase family)
MKFNELIRLLQKNGFHLVREKGSIRYYGKPGHDKLIRVDFTAPERFLRERVMLSLRPPELSGGNA